MNKRNRAKKAAWAQGWGGRIGRTIERLGYVSQKEFARAVGVDGSRVSDWVNGKKQPQGRNLRAIVAGTRDAAEAIRWIREGGPEPPARIYHLAATEAEAVNELRPDFYVRDDATPGDILRFVIDQTLEVQLVARRIAEAADRLQRLVTSPASASDSLRQGRTVQEAASLNPPRAPAPRAMGSES